MRRVFGDALISLGALAVLLITIAAFDDRVRDQFAIRTAGHGAQSDLVSVGTQAREFADLVFAVVREQSFQHAPVMIFVVAAAVLVMFMLRT